MIDLLTQIAQTPPTTAFMLGFSMALALRRGRVEQIMNAPFGGLTGDGSDEKPAEDSPQIVDSVKTVDENSAADWQREQMEQE